ncbi:MAG: FAD-dependent oxidoreductase [Sphingomonadales bacterium]|jgi:NADH dehydrogenase FAD-containing subunit
MERSIILAGGGHAHLGVLAAWARRAPPDTRRTLVTSARHTAYSGMLPGWMAGLYEQRDILIDLAPLAEAAGTEMVLADVTGLDANGLHIGKTGQPFAIASLAIGGIIDTSAFAGSGARLLPVRPVAAFMAGWQAFRAAPGPLVIIGGGAGGFELACAARAVLTGPVTLITAPGSFLAGHAPAVIARARAALAVRAITLIESTATGHPDGVALSDGRVIPAAAIILATGSLPPPWLTQSGLAVTPAGHLAVDATLSTSNPHVFAAGDIIQRTDRPLARSGVHAVKAGPVLAANIAARLDGGALAEYQPPARTLYLLSTADRSAILSWGRVGLAGPPLWWLKHAIDSGFMRRQQP